MSDLVYQNYNNRCKGWTNPSSILFGPEITVLSSYQSPAGSNTVVSISGTNFYSYSTISFGTFNPTVYFINSNILQFYVPNTLSSGTFPVQVFNGSVGSNIVTYTIDNASGYWLLNPTGTISNTNTNASVSVSSLSRGKPVIVTNDPVTSILNPYIVPNNVNWIICNGDEGTSGPIYIKLPPLSVGGYIGREIMLKNISNYNVFSSDGISTVVNILDLDNTPTSNILPPIKGRWVTLVCDGLYWIVMQSNRNII
jgi:hypothetical protein